MKRLFVAIKISPDAAFTDRFRQLKTNLAQERIKWVEENNIHVTLKFLGETNENKIPGIEDILDHVAGQYSAFSIQLIRLGVFGSRYDPRVLWVGIEPYRELADLMKNVHHALQPAGFEPDRQNLVPHLTLGRIKEIKDKQRFQMIIDQFREISSVNMPVTRFILYESILKKEGPTYILLKAFDLQNKKP